MKSFHPYKKGRKKKSWSIIYGFNFWSEAFFEYKISEIIHKTKENVWVAPFIGNENGCKILRNSVVVSSHDITINIYRILCNIWINTDVYMFILCMSDLTYLFIGCNENVICAAVRINKVTESFMEVKIQLTVILSCERWM